MNDMDFDKQRAEQIATYTLIAAVRDYQLGFMNQAKLVAIAANVGASTISTEQDIKEACHYASLGNAAFRMTEQANK